MARISALVIALCMGAASAFVAPVPAARTTALQATTVKDMPGITAPVGYFDPVGYSEKVSPEAMLWFRAAELKHSRVAMLAFVGWCVNGLGVHFPGQLSHDVSFADLAQMAPRDAWEAVPEQGKLQIGGTIAVMEIVCEFIKPHYTKAGAEAYPPMINPSKFMDGAKLRTLQNKELNNGRLAMIGMMGFSAASIIPGSVPML
mmetsp:Transcript_2533/g.5544  ORF Transcript_2533/g.5544 Transcript_2533/m.5544 type:complete len:202 (-) Transcript_2533:242-847(-)|eukprot:CAMPEP_0172646246 /NCGR_PEP_ID=MMETSP1068-20121228/240140_1 /TAXON_ID=35684 /ORGANISM="Pseudopedinella elastica, Strain CCMP716" /LENGTH=201 /DNA_ID=CAMNT_0013460501 /DNA_START=435 /DNA_END=1040 /DNA_ORIENTATION=-